MTKRTAKWLLDVAFVLTIPVVSSLSRADKAVELLGLALVMFRVFDRVFDAFEKELFDGR